VSPVTPFARNIRATAVLAALAVLQPFGCRRPLPPDISVPAPTPVGDTKAPAPSTETPRHPLGAPTPAIEAQAPDPGAWLSCPEQVDDIPAHLWQKILMRTPAPSSGSSWKRRSNRPRSPWSSFPSSSHPRVRSPVAILPPVGRNTAGSGSQSAPPPRPMPPRQTPRGPHPANSRPRPLQSGSRYHRPRLPPICPRLRARPPPLGDPWPRVPYHRPPPRKCLPPGPAMPAPTSPTLRPSSEAHPPRRDHPPRAGGTHPAIRRAHPPSRGHAFSDARASSPEPTPTSLDPPQPSFEPQRSSSDPGALCSRASSAIPCLSAAARFEVSRLHGPSRDR
jgi:hypothetical protein